MTVSSVASSTRARRSPPTVVALLRLTAAAFSWLIFNSHQTASGTTSSAPSALSSVVTLLKELRKRVDTEEGDSAKAWAAEEELLHGRQEEAKRAVDVSGADLVETTSLLAKRKEEVAVATKELGTTASALGAGEANQNAEQKKCLAQSQKFRKAFQRIEKSLASVDAARQKLLSKLEMRESTAEAAEGLRREADAILLERQHRALLARKQEITRQANAAASSRREQEANIREAELKAWALDDRADEVEKTRTGSFAAPVQKQNVAATSFLQQMSATASAAIKVYQAPEKDVPTTADRVLKLLGDMEEKLQEEKKQRLEEENERSHACDASVSLLRNRNELLRKRKSDLEQQRAEKSGAVGVLETEKEEKAAILAQSKEAVRKLKAEIRARTAEYEKTQKTRGDEAEVLASALGLLETEDRDLLTEAKEQVEATRTEDSADSNASDSSEETTESQGESLKSLQDSDSTSRSPKSLQDSEDANESSGASRTEGEEQSEQDAEKDDVEDTATEQGESMTSTSGAEEEVNKDAKQDERKARRKLKVVEQNRRGGEKKNRTSSSKSASSSSDSKRTRKTDRRRRERRGGKKLRLLASRWSSTSSFEDGGSPDAAASSLVDGLFSSSVFLQQQQSRNNKEVLLRAAAFLREQTAGKRNAVAFLAEELQSNAEKGDGAFDRIKAMLSDTIHRLSKEAAAAANKEQWCVREIGNNKADLQDIEEREKDSKARAEEMQSRLAQLVARSKESNKDKRTRQTLWQQQSKQRMDDKKRNLEEAEEMKRAGEKIARARILLQGFYGGQETSGKTSELFALLERLEADYAASLIEATGREVSASAAFGEDRSKFQTEQAALDVRLQHLEATRANVKQEASEKTRDLAMLKDEKDGALQQREELAKQCELVLGIDKKTKEKREKEKRDQKTRDIENLKLVVEMLGS